jgi:hypothetical protein
VRLTPTFVAFVCASITVGCGGHSPSNRGASATAPVTSSPTTAPPSTASSSPAPVTTLTAPAGPKVGPAWRRLLAVDNDTGGPLTDYQVLVVLDSSFSYANASPTGDDLRFTASLPYASGAGDLSYFVEDWTPGGESHIWVLVPFLPAGPSTLHMLYGDASATATSDFATTFRGAQQSLGGGAGSFTATGPIVADWFELRAGDVLTLAQGQPLVINARRVIVTGDVQGEGRGYAGGVLGQGIGQGPGAGGGSTTGGAGGAGYGGAGGLGGYDPGDLPGRAGTGNGTDQGVDLDMGSGGGSTDLHAGGAGGGALSLEGSRITLAGDVSLDGAPGVPTVGGRAGGGGSGGGLLLLGSQLELSGTVSAGGGPGGDASSVAGDGGGGGSGGRIKLISRGTLKNSGTTNVVGGAGGQMGMQAFGAAGAPGTESVTNASTEPRGAWISVGSETLN